MDLIIGKGEVGKSLFNVLKKIYDVRIRDKKPLKLKKKVEILHIAFPYSKTFVKSVKDYIKEYQPEITVIHSTVPVGTTRKCGEKVLHSPVRGMHPSLEESLLVFVKYIGGKKRYAKRIASYFKKAGIKTKIFDKPETTELLKILSTTYYAWNICFCKEVKRICDRYGLSFKEVYIDSNKTYNEGYAKLGKKNVIRPILIPMKGKIGGHCLIPNCHLLKDELTKIILKFNAKY